MHSHIWLRMFWEKNEEKMFFFYLISVSLPEKAFE